MVIYLIVDRLVSINLCCEQNGTEGQAKSGPILSLPLMTIADPIHPLRDMPVCQVIYTVYEACSFHLGTEVDKLCSFLTNL